MIGITSVERELEAAEARLAASARRKAARKRKPPAPTETQEHRAIAEWCKWALPPEVFAFHVPMGSASGGNRLSDAAKGAVPGMVDWLILYRGRAYGIELKERGWLARKAKVFRFSDHERRQDEVQSRLRYVEVPVAIVETLELFQAQLDYWGIPVRSVKLGDEALARAVARTVAEREGRG